MSINKIALVGATGNLGPAILKGLLDGGYEVTILSREGSASTDSLSSHPRQKITKVNFEDVNSLTTALNGIEGVVSNIGGHALLSQKIVIDAAINAGVQRFLPSDFGSDLTLEAAIVPFNKPKAEIHSYLAEKIQMHPSFSYTSVCNNSLLDWGLQHGLFGDLKSHTMTLWDGGETRFSAITLASVGKAVAGVFRNLQATKNRVIRVADTTMTQKQLMEIVKEIDGVEWTTTLGSTAEVYQVALDELEKPEPNMELAAIYQIYRVLFSAECGPDFEDKLNNDVVGLPVMTREQVKEVVRSCME